jgi:hypothetical protein
VKGSHGRQDIKVVLHEIGLGGVNWINQAQAEEKLL